MAISFPSIFARRRINPSRLVFELRLPISRTVPSSITRLAHPFFHVQHRATVSNILTCNYLLTAAMVK